MARNSRSSSKTTEAQAANEAQAAAEIPAEKGEVVLAEAGAEAAPVDALKETKETTDKPAVEVEEPKGSEVVESNQDPIVDKAQAEEAAPASDAAPSDAAPAADAVVPAAEAAATESGGEASAAPDAAPVDAPDAVPVDAPDAASEDMTDLPADPASVQPTPSKGTEVLESDMVNVKRKLPVDEVEVENSSVKTAKIA